MLIIRFLPTEATALGKDERNNAMALQITLERRWKDFLSCFLLLFLSPEVLFIVCLGWVSLVIGEQNVLHTHKLEGSEQRKTQMQL